VSEFLSCAKMGGWVDRVLVGFGWGVWVELYIPRVGWSGGVRGDIPRL